MATSKYYGFAYDPRALDYLKTVPKNIRRQIINKIQRPGETGEVWLAWNHASLRTSCCPLWSTWNYAGTA